MERVREDAATGCDRWVASFALRAVSFPTLIPRPAEVTPGTAGEEPGLPRSAAADSGQLQGWSFWRVCQEGGGKYIGARLFYQRLRRPSDSPRGLGPVGALLHHHVGHHSPGSGPRAPRTEQESTQVGCALSESALRTRPTIDPSQEPSGSSHSAHGHFWPSTGSATNQSGWTQSGKRAVCQAGSVRRAPRGRGAVSPRCWRGRAHPLGPRGSVRAEDHAHGGGEGPGSRANRRSLCWHRRFDSLVSWIGTCDRALVQNAEEVKGDARVAGRQAQKCVFARLSLELLTDWRRSQMRSKRSATLACPQGS